MIQNQREKMIDFQFMKYKLKFQVTQFTVKKQHHSSFNSKERDILKDFDRKGFYI